MTRGYAIALIFVGHKGLVRCVDVRRRLGPIADLRRALRGRP